ncbi:MAG: hypothetical protein M1365_17100 [Actinobacteria bacterium]|nr:hypothetical protein [Actinomycetota bacterium]
MNKAQIEIIAKEISRLESIRNSCLDYIEYKPLDSENSYKELNSCEIKIKELKEGFCDKELIELANEVENYHMITGN